MKKHFLVIWPTSRKDWVSTFFELKAHFQLTFIPSTFKEEGNFAHSFDCRYWSEFNSVSEVLDELQPDKIIFMSIESGLSIVLNFLAQKRGIETIILQHGIFTNYKDYRTREKLWRKNSRAKESKEIQREKGFSTLQFLKNSIQGLDKLKLLPIALYTMLQQKVGPYWVSRYLPLKIKRANTYLCYSSFNATIHRETDRITEEDIVYIGSPELMQYLGEEAPLMERPYYLHMDQALAENSFGEETMDKAIMINFYLKLNDFCLENSSSLFIKLHPESYGSSWLPKHENIHYLRHVDNLNQVIQSASGCFGFYSTMVIPAVYWKPTILFKIQYSGLQEQLVDLGAVQILDFWNFRPSDFKFERYNKPELIRSQFIQPDGTDRYSLVNYFQKHG